MEEIRQIDNQSNQKSHAIAGVIANREKPVAKDTVLLVKQAMIAIDTWVVFPMVGVAFAKKIRIVLQERRVGRGIVLL
jgi:hypothetical protein